MTFQNFVILFLIHDIYCYGQENNQDLRYFFQLMESPPIL
jgi:hypothetical protein